MLSAVAPAVAGWRELQRSEPPRPAAAEKRPDPDVAPRPLPESTGAEARAAEPADTVAPPETPVLLLAADAPADAATDAPGDSSEPCAEESADCGRALAKLRSDPLAAIDLDIRVGGRPGSDYPCECRLEGETFQPRRFATTTFTWKAAGYCHKPLYFEHWNLERYGHSHGFVADSFLSAAHFFARIPALPYQLGVELPWECVYPLGYYRPGSCAPWTVPAVPVSGRGLVVGAATATGIVFILP